MTMTEERREQCPWWCEDPHAVPGETHWAPENLFEGSTMFVNLASDGDEPERRPLEVNIFQWPGSQPVVGINVSEGTDVHLRANEARRLAAMLTQAAELLERDGSSAAPMPR